MSDRSIKLDDLKLRYGAPEIKVEDCRTVEQLLRLSVFEAKLLETPKYNDDGKRQEALLKITLCDSQGVIAGYLACGITTAMLNDPDPFTQARTEERQRCAAIVQRLLNECDPYEAMPDAWVLKRALEEIESPA